MSKHGLWRSAAKSKPKRKKKIASFSDSPSIDVPQLDGIHLQRALENPSIQSITPAMVTSLQRTHGNHYVQRLLAQTRQSAPVADTPASPATAIPIEQKSTQPFVQRVSLSSITKSMEKLNIKDFNLILAVVNTMLEWQKESDDNQREEQSDQLFDEFCEAILSKQIDKPESEEEWQWRTAEYLKENFFEIIQPEIISGQQINDSNNNNETNSDKESAQYTDIGELVQKLWEKRLPISPAKEKEHDMWNNRNGQRQLMLSSALSYVVNYVNSEFESIVTKEEFINAIIEQIKDDNRPSFNDVLNVIATELAQQDLFQSKTLQERIEEIVTDEYILAPDKIYYVGQLMWGSLDWYVRGEDEKGEQQDEFIIWLTDTEDNAPEPSSTAKMNCWEGVIFVLYKAGRISKNKLKALYKNAKREETGVSVAYQVLNVENQTVMYAGEQYTGERPQAGDIVSFWQSTHNKEPHHVALSMGANEDVDNVLSLWWGATGGVLGMTTIQDLNKSIAKITFHKPNLN